LPIGAEVLRKERFAKIRKVALCFYQAPTFPEVFLADEYQSELTNGTGEILDRLLKVSHH